MTAPEGSETGRTASGLLPEEALPDGFAYPPELLRILRLGLVDLEPSLVGSGLGPGEPPGATPSTVAEIIEIAAEAPASSRRSRRGEDVAWP